MPANAAHFLTELSISIGLTHLWCGPRLLAVQKFADMPPKIRLSLGPGQCEANQKGQETSRFFYHCVNKAAAAISGSRPRSDS